MRTDSRARHTLGIGFTKAACLGLVSLFGLGCYNPSVKIDGRAALEQQLTRTAIYRAIDQLAIHKRVQQGEWRIMVVAPDPKDEAWVKACLELRLSDLGVKLRINASDDASIVSAYVTYAGTDIDNFYVGLPIPGSGGQALAFYQSITDRGRASIFLSFQDANGKQIGTTEPVDADAHYTDMYFVTFIGPYATTDLDIQTGKRFSELGKDTLRQAGDTLHSADEWILPDKKQASGDASKSDKAGKS